MVEKKQQMSLEENKYSQEGTRFLAKGDKDLKRKIFLLTLSWTVWEVVWE
jgi:hypothetical protein